MPLYRIDGQVYEAESPDEAYRQHAEKTSPGMVSGLAQQFNQGLTLGGADELQAGVEKLMGGEYGSSLERQRRERAAFQAKHPYLSAGATALGAVAPVVASTVAGTAAGPGGTAAAGGASGSRALKLTLDALYGGGNAVRSANTVAQATREGARYSVVPGMTAGALTADPGERSMGALQGGAFGAGIGGAVGGGVQGLRVVNNYLSPYLREVTDAIGAGRSGMSYMTAPATQTMSQAPITAAEAKVLSSMEAAGIAPEAAAARLDQARRMGVPLGLIDVGGTQTQRLARGVRTLPGEGSNIVDTALERRAASQPDRVINFLEKALGRKSSGNAGRVSDDLLTQSRMESSPFYQQLGGLPDLNDPKILSTFQLPAVQKIVRQAEASRRAWGRSVNPLYDDEGNLLRRPTFQDVDLVKQNIDEMLLPVYRQGPRPADSIDVSTRTSRDMAGDVNRKLVAAADAAPFGDIYANARASYAGPAQARDAFERGLGFPNATLQDVVAMRQTGSPADLKYYGRGVVDALRNKIEGMPDLVSQPNVLRSVAGSRSARAKLEAATPERRVQALRDRITAENEAARTNAFVRSGSQTADKAAEAADVAIDIGTDVATSGLSNNVVARGVRAGYEKVMAGANAETRAEIARMLTNFDDPAAQQALLRRLQELQAQGNLTAQEVANVGRAMTIQNQVE